MAQEIPLTHGKVAVVDDEDARILSKHSWYSVFRGKSWYAFRQVNGREVRMHRLIMGAPEDREVDHFDGNGLNNQRSNLRIATVSQNQGNATCRSDSSGFKGVTQHKNRWVARCCTGKTRQYLGRFSTPEEAARAYDDAARKKWGEFACVNFPRPGERSALTGQIEPMPEPAAAK
jgi:hypothetical protein